MDSRRPGGPGPKTLLPAAIVLAAMTIGGCTVPAPPTGVAPATTTAPAAASPTTPSTSDEQGQGAAKTSGRPVQPDRCHTSMLAASFENLEAGAGQRDVSLVLRNISTQPCNVFGYPGMQLQEADGRPVPTTLERNADRMPELIRLAPGTSAVSTLEWTAINSGSEPDGACEPTADHAEITPPDERDPLMVAWGMGAVCDEGAVRVGSFHQ